MTLSLPAACLAAPAGALRPPPSAWLAGAARGRSAATTQTLVARTPLTPALQMQPPSRGTSLDVFADVRAGGQERHVVLVIGALLVAQRQRRHLLGMNQVHRRRHFRRRVRLAGHRWIDALCGIVSARLCQREDIGEMRRRRISARECRQVEARLYRLEHRCMIDHALADTKYRARLDARRNQDCRYAHTEPREVEAELAGRIVGRRRPPRRRHVIEIAAMLIVGDDQQRFVPGRARAHGIVSVLYQLLAKGNVVVRMLAVAGRAPVRLEKSIGRERAVGGAMLKVAEVAEVALVGM